MRIVINDRNTGAYLKVPDSWVSEIEQASDFESTVSAIHAASRITGKRLEVLLSFGDRRYDLALPVSNDPPPEG